MNAFEKLRPMQSNDSEVTCPRCQARFKPFADAPPTSFAELTHAVPCPKCGHLFSFNEGAQAAAEAQANPPGPFARPADDLNLALRIEEVYPELNDSLASTVQVHSRSVGSARSSRSVRP